MKCSFRTRNPDSGIPIPFVRTTLYPADTLSDRNSDSAEAEPLLSAESNQRSEEENPFVGISSQFLENPPLS
jgi:hypothetical protein